jgi:hypothetical protein
MTTARQTVPKPEVPFPVAIAGDDHQQAALLLSRCDPGIDLLFISLLPALVSRIATEFINHQTTSLNCPFRGVVASKNEGATRSVSREPNCRTLNGG